MLLVKNIESNDYKIFKTLNEGIQLKPNNYQIYHS